MVQDRFEESRIWLYTSLGLQVGGLLQLELEKKKSGEPRPPKKSCGSPHEVRSWEYMGESSRYVEYSESTVYY